MRTAAERWLPLLFVPAALIVGRLAAVEHQRLGRPWTFVVSDVAPGLLIVAAGLFIWWRRPQNRCWWMLTAAGLAWFVGDFQHSTNADVALAAFAYSLWYGPFLAWALLAYPSGRLQVRYDRALVVGVFVLFAIRSLSRLFLHVPPDFAGYGTENRFLPISDDRWWRTVEDLFAWGYTAMIVLVVVSVGLRWARSSRTGRRMMTPALVAASLLAAAVGYQYVIGWNASIAAVTELRIFYIVWWLYAAVAAALAIGLTRLRQTRLEVIDVFAELGPDEAPTRLGPALARALGDPTLALLTWSSAAGGYLDETGRRVEPNAEAPNRAITRIERRGEPVAILEHDVALLEDRGLVNAIVSAVRLTIDNERLEAEITNQLAEVAASRSRIVAAGDAERSRIERDLHDGAQQRLVTIALALRLAETRLGDDADPATRAVLSQSVKDLGEAIEELRDLARGIHPTILTDSGLGAALESLVDRSPLPVQLTIDLPTEPSTAIAATAYFAVSEALTNIAKHTDASRVTVSAVSSDGTLRVKVADDGDGGADTERGSGLRGIADRIAAVDGSWRLHSPQGGGTRIEVELPCESS
jgi:signal transduction histidine kinase